MHGAVAARAFEVRAIRYHYMVGDPELCAVSHFNLANYLMEEGHPSESIGHRIAATMLGWFTNSDMLKSGLNALTFQLLGLEDAASRQLPGSFAELCGTAEQVDGVRFARLLSKLNTDSANLDDAVAALNRKALDFVAEANSRANDRPP